MENILIKLKEIYYHITNKEYEFNLNDNLINDLGMTSVVFVYFMLLIEEEFNVCLDETVYKQFANVSDLVKYINNKIEEAN